MRTKVSCKGLHPPKANNHKGGQKEMENSDSNLGFVVIIPELQPYKYAGYPMLIKTIRMETEDGNVFSKDAPLLTAASELAYHTMNCSALNAEELRRENGIEVKCCCIDLSRQPTNFSGQPLL